MSVGLAGEGPAVEAVRAALGDVDAALTTTEPGRFAAVDFGVLVGTVIRG